MSPREVRLTIGGLTPDNHQEKFTEAVSELAKALKVKTALTVPGQKEEMLPVLEGFVQELLTELKGMNEALGQALEQWMEQGLRKAVDPSTIKLPDDVIFNPKTGKPLTQAEWAKVVGAIDGYFEVETKDLSQRVAQTGAAVAAMTSRLKKVKGLEPDKLGWATVKKKLPKTFDLWATAKTEGWKSVTPIMFRADNIATYVTSVTEDTRNEIKTILNDGLYQQKPVKQISRELFDSLHAKNKDWERIARTEVQNSYTDGAVVSELSDSTPGEKVYMIGMGSVGACKICQRDIVGRIVRLLDSPPKDGEETIDGDPVTDIAIWPGKTSIGHKAGQHWACVTRHPHCACRWVRYFPPATV